MKTSKLTRLLAFFLALLCCVGSIVVIGSASAPEPAPEPETDEEAREAASSITKMQEYLEAISYSEYYDAYRSKNPGTANVSVDLTVPFQSAENIGKYAPFSASPLASALTDEQRRALGIRYDAKGSRLVSDMTDAELENLGLASCFSDGLRDQAVYLSESGSVSFPVNVPSDGLYYIAIDYLTVPGTVNSVQRKLYINDSVPFSEASYLVFSKNWEYRYEVDDETGKAFTRDLNGNDIQPELVQVNDWQTYVCSDSSGYVNGYFFFYLPAGNSVLTFEAEREAVIFGKIEVLAATNDSPFRAPTMAQYLEKVAQYPNGTTKVSKDAKTVIEAEKPDRVSDNSVFMTSDRSSAINSPSSAKSQLFNVIGAESYNTVGQWAAYDFTVPEDGLYSVAMRFQQSALQGMFTCRTIRLWSENRDPAAGVVYGEGDGVISRVPTVPYEEAYRTRFDFSKKWQSKFIGDGDQEFLFYFNKDAHYTIYFEVSLGSLADKIQAVEQSLREINAAYLSIIKMTGATPDENRTYDFRINIPDAIYTLNYEAINLANIVKEFEELCGTNGSHIATLITISNLLSTMGIKERNVAKNVDNLKTYLGTLGTWINDSKTSSLTIDRIVIQSGDAKKPKAKANIFQSIGFEIRSFVMSFFIDYDNMGVTRPESRGKDALNVWLAEGRDQSKIWRSIIDSGFTESTGIPVSLKLVTASTLLPSVLAKSGPDVYQGLGSATVINYAIRGAIDSIRGNEDFAEAIYGVDGEPNTADDVYSPTAIHTLTLLNETYGLPLTMNFPMLFYRLDVLVSLGVSAPTTWDEVLALLPILQSNNLAIGITYTLALDFFLYQNGGSMWKYEDNPEYAGAQIGLDTNEGLYAFQYCTRLYTDYGMAVKFDAANRFRTGEMPLLVSDYVTIYNQLTVFATEIKGLWEFTRIPATVRADGTKNFNSIATVNATVMLHGCKNVPAAWEYMKWQTSAEVEATYGNRMVALIGPSAKYAAANLGAIKLLSWTTKERDAIEDQIRHLSAIVNYPGSYIIARYTNFAFLDVVNKSRDPIDSILNYVPTINAELTRKREEFNMKTLGVGETPPPAEGE